MTADVRPSAFSEAALAEYREILTRYPERRAALLPTLWLAQREFGWLSLPAQEYVAELMEIPLSWVTSVVSFYTMYWTEPKGRHHLQVCVNLSCALRGSDRLCADASSAGWASCRASAPPTVSSRSSTWSASRAAAPRP